MLKSATMKMLFLVSFAFSIACSTAKQDIAPSVPPTAAEPVTVNLNLRTILTVIQAAKLPVDKPFHFDEANDPNKLLGRPNQYVEKVNFKDPDSKDIELSIEIFLAADRAVARCEYIDGIGKSASMFSKYCYVNQNAVLHIDHQMLPSRAKEYEAAFKSIKPTSASPPSISL